MHSPPRVTAHTSTLQFTASTRLFSATLHSLLPGSTRSSTISMRPLAKGSRFKKPGYLSRRSISMAACFSGFTDMESASRSRILYT